MALLGATTQADETNVAAIMECAGSLLKRQWVGTGPELMPRRSVSRALQLGVVVHPIWLPTMTVPLTTEDQTR
jgi:hypothetical protein